MQAGVSYRALRACRTALCGRVVPRFAALFFCACRRPRIGGNGEIVLLYVAPAVPEPGSLALLAGVGVVGAGCLTRRRKCAAAAVQNV